MHRLFNFRAEFSMKLMNKSFQEMGRLRSHRSSLSQTAEVIIKLQRGRKGKEKKFEDKVKCLFVSLPVTPSWLHFTSSVPPIKKTQTKLYFLNTLDIFHVLSPVRDLQKFSYWVSEERAQACCWLERLKLLPIDLYHGANCQALVQCSMVLDKFFPAGTWL